MEPQANRSMMKDEGWLLRPSSVYWGGLWGAVEENGSKHLKFSEPLCLQISSAEESWTAPSDLRPWNGPQIRAPQPKWSSVTLLLQGSFKDTCMLLTLWRCITWEVHDQFHVLQTRGRERSLQKPKRNLIGRRGGEQGPAGAATWATWRPAQLLSSAQGLESGYWDPGWQLGELTSAVAESR